ncbi:glycosyl transferase group 1 [Cyanobacterium stanieri PCC 7202]|uniref:Glycosyl transferase group 1 n=1 Tax=Cyanobacterium stanieri (strain ATCC 29140 / PCC 7202) TaxID=292563 RepID=K9YHU6_CYASC|nr:glycosyl transferase group 1 [Cyanobacterium stanieri PCC 7202]
MKNKKISVIAPDLSGGGMTRVYIIATTLQNLGYEVKVFGLLFGENIYPQPPIGLPVVYTHGTKFPQIWKPISDLAKEIDGDLIYAIKPKPTSLGIAYIISLLKRKPLMLDIDDWEMSWFGGEHWQYKPTIKQLMGDLLKKNGALRDLGHPLYIKWSEKLVDKANAITVNTRFLQSYFGGTYLPSGKNTEMFNPDKFNPQLSREKYGLLDYRILMFPGTPRPHKGLEDVLMAIKLLNQTDIKLVIVGGRNIGDGYMENLKNEWSEFIIYLPPCPFDSMPEIISAAHIVVVPQRKTTTAIAQFPIKLTDAMAMAKPIIATKVGDIPEILNDQGYLVEPESPIEIKQVIGEIFENYDVALKKGKKIREHCINHYSIDSMGSTLEKIIDSVH